MKKCGKCKMIKRLDLFPKNKAQKDGYGGNCRECKKVSDTTSYQKKHPNCKANRAAPPVGFKFCGNKKCLQKDIYLSYESFNKDKDKKDGLCSYCRECSSIASISYREDNSLELKEYLKSYRVNNIVHLNEYIKKYVRDRKKNDPVFKLICARRVRRHQSLLSDKHDDILQDLGCSLSEWRQYMELKFQDGMAWNNHGKFGWHIDEIIPISAWDQSKDEERKACWHYLNSQPLWAKENIAKGGATKYKQYSQEKLQFLMVLRALDIL